jgi:hypothetical protein
MNEMPTIPLGRKMREAKSLVAVRIGWVKIVPIGRGGFRHGMRKEDQPGGESRSAVLIRG